MKGGKVDQLRSHLSKLKLVWMFFSLPGEKMLQTEGYADGVANHGSHVCGTIAEQFGTIL